MDWTTIISLIIGLITGGGFSTLITLGLVRRQKKGEVAKLEVDVRKLQDNELRERATQLVRDLSEANDTIRRISSELQIMITEQAEKDIRIARLEAENKILKERACGKYCDCLNFEKDEKFNTVSS